jgi:hypothetical protein
MRQRPSLKSISTSVVSSKLEFNCGVSVPRTSGNEAKALTIKLTGEVTL